MDNCYSEKPFTPVQLTLEGDSLDEPPSNYHRHYTDNLPLGACTGVHAFCNGWLYRRAATATHDAIVCQACCMRVLFPKEVSTIGDLRRALIFPTKCPK